MSYIILNTGKYLILMINFYYAKTIIFQVASLELDGEMKVRIGWRPGFSIYMAIYLF